MMDQERESERQLTRPLLTEFFEFLKATEIVVAALLVATAGGVWWTIRGDGATATASNDDAPPQPTSLQIAPADPVAPSTPNVQTTRFQPADPTTVSRNEAEIDFSLTSWENPFTPAHWESAGWSFAGGMMQSAGDRPAQAVFRRSYRKLRLDVQLERLGPVGTFEVRLRALESNAVMTVTFGGNAVVVSADCPQQKGVIKRKDAGLEMTPGQPGHLSLIATGNRVRIFWNDRPLLTCPQPASQSGRDLTFALISQGAAFRVSGLRIEGE